VQRWKSEFRYSSKGPGQLLLNVKRSVEFGAVWPLEDIWYGVRVGLVILFGTITSLFAKVGECLGFVMCLEDCLCCHMDSSLAPEYTGCTSSSHSKPLSNVLSIALCICLPQCMSSQEWVWMARKAPSKSHGV